MPSAVRIDDIYRIAQPVACRLSPDGARAVAVVSQPDREQLKNVSHLWMCDVAGAKKPFQFTHGKASESSPKWSRDGKRIAFLSARSGKSEIWVIAADGGEARQLTNLGGSISEFEWSPNGKKLALIFTPQDDEATKREEMKKRGEPGHESPMVREISRLFYKLDGAGFLPGGKAHLWVVDAAGGKGKQLLRDEKYTEGDPCWSPDGRAIYFVSCRTGDPERELDRNDIWRIPAGGGRFVKIRKFAGGASNISVSPDGKWIAFLGQPDPDARWSSVHTKLWLIPSTGGKPALLSRGLDRSISNSAISDTFGIPPTPRPSWSPDSREVAFVMVSEGAAEIWKAGVANKKLDPLLQQPGVPIDWDVDWANRRIVSAFSDLHTPGEVRVDAFQGSAGAPRTISAFNAKFVASRRLAMPREVWSRTRKGYESQGWILLPPGLGARRKCPAVLYVHGGPATQYSKVYFNEFQVLAAKGFAVIYCNPRCSTGYSEKHMSACAGDWGSLDYDDLMAFTDECLRLEPRLDRRRLGCAGGSYGGFMVNWIVGHTDRFKAGVSSRGISNFLSFVGSSDFGYAWPKGYYGEDNAWGNTSKYLKMSPLAYLKNMKTPVLIEHQEEDHRCPVEQAEQLWAALKWKGVPCEFVRYPQEPHGMSRSGRPDRRVDRLERIVAWFGRWLR
ncbi:MAG: putative S9 family [Planctomycetota bacterium]|nr:MAG: putative S9 family [Planctomycetota bacterium]